MPTHTPLIDLLTSTADRPLTADERAAILAALAELAAAQSTIATQSMLLASYAEDTEAIERSARAVINQATEALRATPPPFDPADAAAARQALLEATTHAASLGTIAAAALAFALRVAGVPRLAP